MVTECPHCGQKLRDDWARCPRCRRLVAEAVDAPASVAPASTRRALWPWVAAGAVVLLVIVVIMTGESNSSAVATAPAGVAAAPDSANASAGATVSRVVPPSPLPYQALESIQAGHAAFATGDLAGAVVQYEAAVAEDPNNAEARNNLGVALVRQGKARAALPHAEEAVRLRPDNWHYRFNRARNYGELDRWNDAATEYQATAQLAPGDFATYYNLGLVQLRLKDYPAAVTALEKAIALEPSQHGFLIDLGTALVGAGNNQRARQVFEQFLQRAPDAPEAARVKALLEALAAAP